MKKEFIGVSLLTRQPFLVNVELLETPTPEPENPIRNTLRHWFCLAGGATLFSLTRLLGF
jgi:hypothetical protein